MRVSTSDFFRQATQAIVQQEADLSRQLLKLGSGQRILQPSDDPTGSARVLGIDSKRDINVQFTRNAGQAESRLRLVESSLGGVAENLQRVRELTIQAANATQTNNTRSDIALEIEQRLQELKAIANTTDANGEYIFAGSRSHTSPFVASAGVIAYQGDDSQRFVAIGEGRQVAVSDPGSRVFMGVPAGNGIFEVDVDPGNTGSGVIGTGSVLDRAAFPVDDYVIEFMSPDQFEIRDGSGLVIGVSSYTSGESIDLISGIEFTIEGVPDTGDRFSISPAGTRDLFSGYQELINALRQPVESEAAAAKLRTTINRTLTGLDQSISHVTGFRADVGGRLRVIESQTALNDDRAFQLESARSAVMDLDYTEAVSRLQQQIGALQVAQQGFVRIQGLSLFRLLG